MTGFTREGLAPSSGDTAHRRSRQAYFAGKVYDAGRGSLMLGWVFGGRLPATAEPGEAPTRREHRSIMVPGIALIMVFTAVYGAISLVVRPAMYSDSGYGFMVWDSMRRGAAFNYMVSPDSTNISRDVVQFFTTWSPGQYLVPGVVELLGVKLGVAIILIVSIFSALGLAGWLVLYRALGFPPRTAVVAVAIVACSRHFGLPFGVYNGGEVLLFGGTPWFFLLVWSFRDYRWLAPPLLLVAGFVLIFLKLSGLIIAACAIAAAAVCAEDSWRKRETIAKILMAGATVGIMGLAFYFGWFSRGWNVLASATPIDWPKILPYTVFVTFATWGSAVSIGDLVAFVFLNPGRALLTSGMPVYYAAFPVVLGTFAFVWWRLRARYGEYLRFAFLIAAAFAAVMVISWSRGAEIELDERYFRPASLLLFVGVVHALLGVRSRLLGGSLVATAAGLALYGVLSFAAHARENVRHPLGVRGFRQHLVSPAALDFLHSIDVPAADGSRAVIYVPSPEIALDVRNARSIVVHIDAASLALLQSWTYRGRVSRLYVLLQKNLVAQGKAAAVLNSFVDYRSDEWSMIPLGDFVCFFRIS
jgi:hypothetical protein